MRVKIRNYKLVKSGVIFNNAYYDKKQLYNEVAIYFDEKMYIDPFSGFKEDLDNKEL